MRGKTRKDSSSVWLPNNLWRSSAVDGLSDSAVGLYVKALAYCVDTGADAVPEAVLPALGGKGGRRATRALVERGLFIVREDGSYEPVKGLP
jgi:hypothetical protein